MLYGIDLYAFSKSRFGGVVKGDDELFKACFLGSDCHGKCTLHWAYRTV